MPSIGNGKVLNLKERTFKERENRLQGHAGRLLTVMIYTRDSPTVLVAFTYPMNLAGRDAADLVWEMARDQLDDGDATDILFRDINQVQFRCSPQEALEAMQLLRNYVSDVFGAANDIITAADFDIDLEDDAHWPPYAPYDSVAVLMARGIGSLSDPARVNYLRRSRRRWRRLGVWSERT